MHPVVQIALSSISSGTGTKTNPYVITGLEPIEEVTGE